MDKINLIIPCAGSGQRFIDAGFGEYKPLINSLGKPMIWHVIDSFPDITNVWIITDEKHKIPLSESLKKNNNINFISIDTHKNGPAWSVLKAEGQLPKNESCFIAYNDVTWKWNFVEVLNFIKLKHADGVVFTQTGFHPHLFKNNFSAFCKINNTRLIELKEKGSFTDDWMNEPLSTGVYYYSDTNLMLENTKFLIEKNNRTAGEFFPSEIYNLMLEQGLSVFTYETTDFIHLGVPDQHKDAEEWRKILKSTNIRNNVPVLIMMGGEGSRMKSVSPENKAGILIDGNPMYEFVAEKIGSDNNFFLVNDETLPLIRPGMQTINIHNQTKSQTESFIKAIKNLPDSDNLLVMSNDCYGIFDLENLKDLSEYKMVLFGFEPRLMHKKQGKSHSGFSFSDTNVNEIHIKSLGQNDLGLAGMYYFPDKSILTEFDNFDYENNDSMDCFAQHLIRKKYKVGYVKLNHYVHLGTPEELKEYLFWKKFFMDNRHF